MEGHACGGARQCCPAKRAAADRCPGLHSCSRSADGCRDHPIPCSPGLLDALRRRGSLTSATLVLCPRGQCVCLHPKRVLGRGPAAVLSGPPAGEGGARVPPWVHATTCPQASRGVGAASSRSALTVSVGGCSCGSSGPALRVFVTLRRTLAASAAPSRTSWRLLDLAGTGQAHSHEVICLLPPCRRCPWC